MFFFVGQGFGGEPTGQRRHGVLPLQRRAAEETGRLFTQGASSLPPQSVAVFVFCSAHSPPCAPQTDPLATRLRSLRPAKKKKQQSHAYQTRSAQVRRPGTRRRGVSTRRNSGSQMDSESDGEVRPVNPDACFNSVQVGLFSLAEITVLSLSSTGSGAGGAERGLVRR